MKIYVDGLFYKCAGIGRYYTSLVKGLVRKGVSIHASVPKDLIEDFREDFKDVISKITVHEVCGKKFSIRMLFSNYKLLYSLMGEVDLFWYPHVNVPLFTPKNIVVTIHDVCPLNRLCGDSKVNMLLFRLLLLNAVAHCRGLLFISHFSSNEFYNHIKIADSMPVRVIYPFPDTSFGRRYSRIRVLDSPYLLFVGNRKKHKNIRNMLVAFKVLIGKVDCKLVIAGSKFEEYDEVDLFRDKYDMKDKVIEYINPSDEVLLSLYDHAEALVFPSLYEGFGMPPLEAMCLRCPVIISDIAVHRELHRNGNVLFVDPYSPESICDAMLNVISSDRLRESLIAKASRELERFDGDRIIDKYISFFKELLRV